MLTQAAPENCGLDPQRWDNALRIARDWAERDDRVPAIGLLVARGGHTPGPVLFGRQKIAAGSPKM